MPGPLDSVRALGASFFALVRTRIELAVIELREEGERRKAMVMHAAVAGVFLALGALLFAILVIVIFWDTHRVAAAAVMTAAYLGIGWIAFGKLKQAQREAPPPFEATLAELAQDMEAFRGGGNE